MLIVVSYNRVPAPHHLFLHYVTSVSGSDQSVRYMFTSRFRLSTHDIVVISFVSSYHLHNVHSETTPMFGVHT